MGLDANRPFSWDSFVGQQENSKRFSLSPMDQMTEAAIEAHDHTIPSSEPDGEVGQMLSQVPQRGPSAADEPMVLLSGQILPSASPHSSHLSLFSTPVISEAAAGLLPLPPSPSNADFGWAVNNDDFSPAARRRFSTHSLSLHPPRGGTKHYFATPSQPHHPC
jgi:hypothetical protein